MPKLRVVTKNGEVVGTEDMAGCDFSNPFAVRELVKKIRIMVEEAEYREAEGEAVR